MDKEKQQQQFPLVKKTVSRDNSGKKQCRNYNKIWYEIKKSYRTHEEKTRQSANKKR